MIIGWHSIRGRLLWLSAGWLTAALLTAYLIIGGILEQFITDRFDAEAAAMADALMAGTQADADGLAQLYDIPADPRFTIPLSGWYWQLEANGDIIATGDSLQGETLSPATGNTSGVFTTGPDGAALRLFSHGYTVPESSESLSVSVTVPQIEIDAALNTVRRPLAMTLAVLGLGLALAVLAQVTAGLSAFRRLGRDLRTIRAGQTETLPLPDASELRPVVQEINALLTQNRNQLFRTREQMGNLAHSLKTPLMALQGGMDDNAPGRTVIARMDRQIAWHLKRARSAGGRRVLGQHSNLAKVTDDIGLVLAQSLKDRGIRLEQDFPNGLTLPVEEQDAQEILGNLMENAAKWARSRIIIRAYRNKETIDVVVADDGPGMAASDHVRALSRGTRLDERGPGSGLGLAIVADLAMLNGGKLQLDRDSGLGGLSAQVSLPC
ncbi:MAG: sensor histidine kinase [Paracoccus sp. (in: a-proteobacteria)]